MTLATVKLDPNTINTVRCAPLFLPCASVCWPSPCLSQPANQLGHLLLWCGFSIQSCGTKPISLRRAVAVLSQHLLAPHSRMFFNAAWLIRRYVKYCLGNLLRKQHSKFSMYDFPLVWDGFSRCFSLFFVKSRFSGVMPLPRKEESNAYL